MGNLNEALGTLPLGGMRRIDDDSMTMYLRDEYLTSDVFEKKRATERKALDLYYDRYLTYAHKIIEGMFKNPLVRELRKKMVPYSGWQSITRRITDETSAVYANYGDPVVRNIRTGSKKYRDLQLEIQFNERMEQFNGFVNLHNQALIWPDVNFYSGMPELKVVTSDKFWPIAHPNDPLTLVGVIIERIPRRKTTRETDPHYLVIDEETMFHLDKAGRMVPNSRKAHEVGTLPVELVHRRPPVDRLWDADSGQDLISAHETILMLNCLMMKNQKSGTKQPYASGDTSMMAQGQPMEEESMVRAPEGVSFSTLDLGANPDSYIKAARHTIKSVAANRGIPESVYDLSYQASSGYEIKLKRTGLLEIRRRQIPTYRAVERRLAEKMAKIISVAKDERAKKWAYNPAGWGINYGDIEVPSSPMEALLYEEKEEQLDLVNRVDMYMRRNPEVDADEAEMIILANEAKRVERMDRFQRHNAGTFGPTGSANQPEGNAKAAANLGASAMEQAFAMPQVQGGPDVESLVREVLNAA